AILLVLRDAVIEQHPEVMETLHGHLLVKVADRFAEVLIGPSQFRRDIEYGKLQQALAVQSGCGGDGVTCLPGTSGTSYAVFSHGGICDAEKTAYGDSVCRGRCGI